MIENGVNRLNIGVQSLNDRLLKSINRRHDANMVLKNISLVQDLGISNVNIDIMYGLQGQTMKDWMNTVDQIIKQKVQSISTYRLRIHPRGKISDQVKYFDENKVIQMYIAMMEKMDIEGFFQCSSHKFAIKEEFAQKQIVNKRGIGKNTLIPLGMAAYGYINDVLFWNARDIENYRKRICENIMPYTKGYVLSKFEQMSKDCVLGIHNVKGIDLIEYKNKYGEDINAKYKNLIDKLRIYGLVENDNRKLILSKLGMIFADEIATQFYSDQVKLKLKKQNKRYGIFFDEIL